ncbi:MAG: T9SS type A sorting domain-containing protein [Bacteroidales bacterium]|nr:T9SS type A sorting domain-containing protein [Bacteroidales bacterium]
MAKYGMAIDLYRCTGCGACALGCKNENNTEASKFGKSYNWADFFIKTEGTFSQGNLKHFVFPTLCNHCENAPCITACPVNPKALYKTDDGITMLNHERCIGCGFCIHPCPYSDVNLDIAKVQYSVITQNARSYDNYEPHNFYYNTDAIIPGCTSSPSDMVEFATEIPPDANLYYHPDTMDVRVKDKCEKCTFCDHRITLGLEPACIEACPAHARMFGDLDDPNSEINAWLDKGYVRLKNNKGELIGMTEPNEINPKVFYIGDFGPVGINEVIVSKEKPVMKVYPNPSNATTNIEVEVTDFCNADITVFDISGRKVIISDNNYRLSPGKNTLSINVSNLLSGTYVVRLVADNQIYTSNLIVKR